MNSTIIMMDGSNNIKDNCLRYSSPEIAEIYVNAQSVLCQSNGNDSMLEYDYRDGGFGEV